MSKVYTKEEIESKIDVLNREIHNLEIEKKEIRNALLDKKRQKDYWINYNDKQIKMF